MAAQQVTQLGDQLELSHSESALPVAVDDPRAIQIVRRQLHPYAVTRKDPDAESAHLSGDVAEHDPVHVVELYAEHRVRQGLDDLTFELNLFFFWHRR